MWLFELSPDMTIAVDWIVKYQNKPPKKSCVLYRLCALHILTLCMLGNFCMFLSSADFFKINFLKKSFRNTIILDEKVAAIKERDKCLNH